MVWISSGPAWRPAPQLALTEVATPVLVIAIVVKRCALIIVPTLFWEALVAVAEVAKSSSNPATIHTWSHETWAACDMESFGSHIDCHCWVGLCIRSLIQLSELPTTVTCLSCHKVCVDKGCGTGLTQVTEVTPSKPASTRVLSGRWCSETLFATTCLSHLSFFCNLGRTCKQPYRCATNGVLCSPR